MPASISRSPLGRIEHHEAARAAVLVVGEVSYGEGLGRQEAVALGQVAGHQPMHGVIAMRQGEAHRLAVEDGRDALQRAHPGEVAAAPAHGLRPGEAAQHGRHRVGQDIGAPASPRRASQHPELALPGVSCSCAGAMLAEEAFQRLVRARRRAGRVPRLPALGPGTPSRRPGRGGAGRTGARRRRHQRAQLGMQQAGEILRRPGLHAGGDFLGEQLERSSGIV